MIWLYDLTILILIITSIGLDAYSDAYIDNDISVFPRRHHWAESLSILALISTLLLFTYQISWFNVAILQKFILIEISKMFLAYCALRAGTFNLFYNTFRNIGLKYIGTTDDIFDKLIGKLPSFMVPILYMLCIFAGITLIFV